MDKILQHIPHKMYEVLNEINYLGHDIHYLPQLLLMVQKSCDHQLRLIVLFHYLQGFITIPGGFLAGFPLDPRSVRCAQICRKLQTACQATVEPEASQNPGVGRWFWVEGCASTIGLRPLKILIDIHIISYHDIYCNVIMYIL